MSTIVAFTPVGWDRRQVHRASRPPARVDVVRRDWDDVSINDDLAIAALLPDPRWHIGDRNE
jgi:hypothetical protein